MINNLIALDNPKSRVAEAFRTLRTNIQFSSLDNNLKSILITSTAPSEGKSTVIINLGLAMAQSGKKVLIIDCDLRKPSIHKKLSIPNTKGLTSILIGDVKIEDCITPLSVNNLSVLSCGATPPNPSELLGTKKMKQLIEELEGMFDVVLIDSPPVIAVTDAQIISTFAKGVILVSAYGQTEKGAIINAKNLLDKVGANIIGVVMNKIPEESHGYGYGYGRYYNKYYNYNAYYEEKEDSEDKPNGKKPNEKKSNKK
ncbi:MAG: CpsD/CapB family tyrosine-protein kinase [Bacillota bacterium]|nr:CpsD/CapB family tyrosine-protein kinase [Bacillota bacterium]